MVRQEQSHFATVAKRKIPVKCFLIRKRRLSRLKANVKRESTLLFALSVVLSLSTFCPGTKSYARESIPDRLFVSQKAPLYPDPTAPMPSRDKVIIPPGETSTFPVRPDGQPYVLNLDTTINFTEALNRFYFDPKWRGEVWVPFNQWSLVERATRLMATWPEYDQANQYRKLNRVNKFFERCSGFGP